MARSLYKGENLGSLPPCAICVGKGRGKRAEVHLPCGVRVWLCEAHRSAEFMTSRVGRDLVVSLMHVWRGTGCFTRARSRALDIHQRRLTGPPAERERPGSYAWPELRQEAEAAWASGERPATVINRLRQRAARGEARAPSVRTMQRWFREGRWLGGPGAGAGPGGNPGPGPRQPPTLPGPPPEPNRLV